MTDALGMRLGSSLTPAIAACVDAEPNPADVEQAAKWQIHECPVNGVTEFGALVDTIRTGRHAIDVWDFERRLKLGALWEWDDLAFRIGEGLLTAERLDQAIHAGLASGTSQKGHITVPGPR